MTSQYHLSLLQFPLPLHKTDTKHQVLSGLGLQEYILKGLSHFVTNFLYIAVIMTTVYKGLTTVKTSLFEELKLVLWHLYI